jgi:glycosyltransferase involved in cell wall biosynthesis
MPTPNDSYITSLVSEELENKLPKVTIVIPVFNGANLVRETVESVQKSTYTDFEVLLINDGSSDKSEEVCMELADRYSHNTIFHSFKQNEGLAHTLNFGLEYARGEYIARLNQDDIVRPDRIEKQVAFLDSNPKVVAVGSWIRLFDNEDNQVAILKFMPTDKAIRKHWLVTGPFSDPTVMYRKQPAIDVGGYEQKYWPADDTQMWYKLGKIGELANIQEVLVDVRWHGSAGSLKYMGKMAWSLYKAHRFAHRNVQKASILVQIYWVLQLIGNRILPPRLSWWIYRQLKKLIAFFLEKQH